MVCRSSVQRGSGLNGYTVTVSLYTPPTPSPTATAGHGTVTATAAPAPSCLDSESFSLGQDGSEKMKHVWHTACRYYQIQLTAATHLVVSVDSPAVDSQLSLHYGSDTTGYMTAFNDHSPEAEGHNALVGMNLARGDYCGSAAESEPCPTPLCQMRLC